MGYGFFVGKKLKPWTVLLIGSSSMGTLLAVAAMRLGRREDVPRAVLVGGLFGLVLFGGVAWASKPDRRPSPETLNRVERRFRLFGLLGAALYAAGAWLESPVHIRVAAFCAAFGGFFIATAAEMRLDSLKDPGSFADRPKV